MCLPLSLLTLIHAISTPLDRMQLTLQVFTILLSTCKLVSAAGTLGFALGDKQASGACKSAADYASDFAAISAATDSKIVRIYAASDCSAAQQILPAAKENGFQVILGIWPDTDASCMFCFPVWVKLLM